MVRVKQAKKKEKIAAGGMVRRKLDTSGGLFAEQVSLYMAFLVKSGVKVWSIRNALAFLLDSQEIWLSLTNMYLERKTLEKNRDVVHCDLEDGTGKNLEEGDRKNGKEKHGSSGQGSREDLREVQEIGHRAGQAARDLSQDGTDQGAASGRV